MYPKVWNPRVLWFRPASCYVSCGFRAEADPPYLNFVRARGCGLDNPPRLDEQPPHNMSQGRRNSLQPALASQDASARAMPCSDHRKLLRVCVRALVLTGYVGTLKEFPNVWDQWKFQIEILWNCFFQMLKFKSFQEGFFFFFKSFEISSYL